jgi:glycosyltransferase involved in cell wall biosynthesis
LPLWCVSPEPNSDVKALLSKIPGGLVRFARNLDSATLQAMYSRASAFLFPSLAEGFGWPIIEAMACGCPVITTGEAPMNEVGGEAACYLPRLKALADRAEWARGGAKVLSDLLGENEEQKGRRRAIGYAWVKRFDSNRAIDGYLSIYQRIVDMEQCGGSADCDLNESTRF